MPNTLEIPQTFDQDFQPPAGVQMLQQGQPQLTQPQNPLQQLQVDQPNFNPRSPINPDLIAAIVHQESGNNPIVVGKSGEIGLMQIMPSTAAQYGITNRSELFKPEVNRSVGTRYLTDLYNKYGDITKALEAYNAGPHNVDRGHIPKSTQAYVKNILARYNKSQGGRELADSQPAMQLPSFQPGTSKTTVAQNVLQRFGIEGTAQAEEFAPPPGVTSLGAAPGAGSFEPPPGVTSLGAPVPLSTPKAGPTPAPPGVEEPPHPSTSAALPPATRAVPASEAFNIAVLSDPNQRFDYLKQKYGDDNVTTTPDGAVLLKYKGHWMDTNSSTFQSLPEFKAGLVKYGMPIAGQMTGAGAGMAVGGPLLASAGAAGGSALADEAQNKFIREPRGLPTIGGQDIALNAGISGLTELGGQAIERPLMGQGRYGLGRYAEQRPLLELSQKVGSEITPSGIRAASTASKLGVEAEKTNAELLEQFGGIVGMSPQQAQQRIAGGGLQNVSRTYDVAREATRAELAQGYQAIFQPIEQQPLKGVGQQARRFSVNELKTLAYRSEPEKKIAHDLLAKAALLPADPKVGEIRNLYLQTQTALRSLPPSSPQNAVPRGSLQRLRKFLEQRQDDAVRTMGRPGDYAQLQSLNRQWGTMKENLPYLKGGKQASYLDRLYNPNNETQLRSVLDGVKKSPNPTAALSSLRRGFIMKLFRDANNDPGALIKSFNSYPQWFKNELFQGLPGELKQAKTWANLQLQMKSIQKTLADKGNQRSMVRWLADHAKYRLALMPIMALAGYHEGGVEEAAKFVVATGAFLGTLEGAMWVMKRPALMRPYMRWMTAQNNASKLKFFVPLMEALAASGATYEKQPEPQAQPNPQPTP